MQNVVRGGYCIGCGACASVPDSPIQMTVNEFGLIQPELADPSARPPIDVHRVCPFSGAGPNEDELAGELFPDAPHDRNIGRHLAVHAGWVEEGEFRQRGSSGGMASWIITQLLESGQIDGVLHIHHREPTADDDRVFEYGLSTTLEQVCRNSKSQYYPIEMSQVVQTVRQRPGRYAFIGIPCFNKAMRLLQQHDPVIRERVTVCISLVCGHLKSMRWTELLTWQKGMDPGSIDGITFRETDPNFTARDYIFTVSGKADGQAKTDRFKIQHRLGGIWSDCFFMYEACDYCDDVVGETADLTIGDAWLPQYTDDYRGTNLLIARRKDLLELIEQGRDAGRVHLEPLTVEQAVESQAGGLRHRRGGLAYRLALKQQAGRWYPPKRVEPSVRHLNRRRRKLYRLRSHIAQRSHVAYQQARENGSLQPFIDEMAPLARRCNRISRSFAQRLVGRFKWYLRGRFRTGRSGK